ncbi:methyl-accepting chemotaxis protein [Herbaspirillum sp. WGmk3]|uniref:methyl-accepting chemotaxis protein n=1 Tax=Herbaspirillum sp. WGmk3 TaxID=2919925 RepID=UPI0020906AC9|nr:methyl-accepting chemotaxis protein [Herbaspirillum sp. WGmk3]MCO4858367.1 methyl-accepting chemotaxis protein [Herbaspirillum sp. WGmk3]
MLSPGATQDPRLPVIGRGHHDVQADMALGEDEYLITRTDIEGRMVYVNEAFVARSGYAADELLGQSASMMYAPDTPSEVGADLWRTVKARGAWTGVMRHRCKDGRCFWARATITRTMVDGRHVGHTTVRTRAADGEVRRMRTFAAARRRGAGRWWELREGRLGVRGIGRLMRLCLAPTLAWRMHFAQGLNAALLLVALFWLAGSGGAAGWLAIVAVLLSLWQAAVLALAARRVSRPVEGMLRHARSIGAGDLTQAAARQEGSDDEVARLAVSMDVMQKSLASLVRDLREGVVTVGGAAAEISDANMDLAARTEETAAAVEQSAHRMAELDSAVQRNAASAAQAHGLATASVQAAEAGSVLVRQVIGSMDEISRSAGGIAEISSVIEGIAFQTNILALNAAVEAARAGVHGRGFAVVASEVRSLAQRSGDAVRQISQLLERSGHDVTTGVKLAGQAGDSLEQIVALARKVGVTVGEISEASRQQGGEIAHINHVIGQIDDAVRQNAAMVEQAAAAAAALAGQSRRLEQSVAMFRTRQ